MSLEELGKRVVKCAGFRWLPGMKFDAPGYPGERLIFGEPILNETGEAIPDLSDPATLGCLLALAREAWESITVWVEPGPFGSDGGGICWESCVYRAGFCVLLETFDTEAEALVAALEAADGK